MQYVVDMLYPRVPEELGENHQISGVQGEAHVGCSDGQNSHAALGRVLEPLTELLSIR